jgi:hypothetical protein
MGKYVLVYRGGSFGETEADQEAVMLRWMTWFGELGDSVVDLGNPFGPSATIGSDGTVTPGGSSELTGYSIVEAADLAEASDKASGCPVLAAGGSIEVYEAVPIG